MDQFAKWCNQVKNKVRTKTKTSLHSLRSQMNKSTLIMKDQQQLQIKQRSDNWKKFAIFFQQASSRIITKTKSSIEAGTDRLTCVLAKNGTQSLEKDLLFQKDQDILQNTQITEASSKNESKQDPPRRESSQKLKQFVNRYVQMRKTKQFQEIHDLKESLKAKAELSKDLQNSKQKQYDQQQFSRINQKNQNSLENPTELNNSKGSSNTITLSPIKLEENQPQSTIKSAFLTPSKQRSPAPKQTTPSNKKPPLPLKLLPEQDLKLLQFQDDSSDKLFQSYVQQERLMKIKRQVESLKKQHLITNVNYDASDEQDPEQADFNKKFKLKTQMNIPDYKFFEPRIYVFEAPQGEILSSLKIRAETEQKEWPLTDPKQKKNQKSLFVSPLLSKSPDLNKRSMKTKSYAGLAPDHTQRLARLKEAKRKKFDLSKKLEQLNKQLEELRAAQNIFHHSKSPKNSLKNMIHIADDRNARIKAMSLVHRLKIQKIKREKVINNIFRRVDSQITNSIDQMTKVRAERDRRQKQKKQLSLLERMRDQERKKLEQYRLQSANVHFLHALKKYEQKKYGKHNNSPEFNRNDAILKLRNLSQKRSLLEDYNRDLFRKP